MGKPAKKPSGREYVIAKGLLEGKSRRQACLGAGYSVTSANNRSVEITSREGVALALVELGAGLGSDKLGNMGKARLYEDLVKPPKGDKGAKARLGIIRTALEVGGHLGGPSELHLHQHNALPPAAEKILLEKMKQMFGQKQEVTIDASISGSEVEEGIRGELEDPVQGDEQDRGDEGEQGNAQGCGDATEA